MINNGSIYLSQFYKDAEADFNRSLTRTDFPCWDRVVITASNERQADYYRKQIKSRSFPEKTVFTVIPDENGERIGSGGATLSVIRRIYEEEKKPGEENPFSRLKILVIHSGGDSKRIPQYSALGKLFSPVPRVLGSGASSTLFDEILCTVASIPSRITGGMLLMSGDVLLLFNPLLIDSSGTDGAVISFKESVQTGKNHGVYLKNDRGYVKSFLHKQSVESLEKRGAVNAAGQVDIDTGALMLSPEILLALYSLVDNDEKYFSIVNNKVRLSLYSDIQYALAEDSTLEKFYLEKGEGELCEELMRAREKVWTALHGYRLRLLCMSPAKFIHFGTSAELKRLMTEDMDYYSYLGWKKQTNSSFDGETSGYNSVVSPNCKIGPGCYIESSYIHSGAVVGQNCIISYTDLTDETVPQGVILHTLKTVDGKFVCRILGIDDNPKEEKLFGKPISGFCEKYGIVDAGDLWYTELYAKCGNVRSAVNEALNLYKLFHGEGDGDRFISAEKMSLKSSFELADTNAIMDWNTRMYQLTAADRVEKAMQNGIPSEEIKGCLGKALSPIQSEWYEQREKYYFDLRQHEKRIKLHYYMGCALQGAAGEAEKKRAFRVIRDVLSSDGTDCMKKAAVRGCENVVQVSLPLRVNWGGGWSDTPPFCNENGGTVINAAIRLNGDNPVYVRVKKTQSREIVFLSDDLNVRGSFTQIEPLQDTGNPFDPFALQKAALAVVGIIPQSGGSLEDLFEAIGGGFEVKSEVNAVPKGSGLGTSSILGAAVVKALMDFFRMEYTQDELYRKVLLMEQIMSTGGGWQDQIGGLTDGIKYITSKPGINQEIKVCRVETDGETREKFRRRFALIYTGQRRLARNLLRDVVGKYIGGDPETVNALNEIQKIAALMRFELERGHFDDFAKLLDRHWEYSKIIDSETTNTLIEQIFDSVSDLIDAKMICGAGGGGFLQVIMSEGVTKEDLHNRLKSVFSDSLIDVWDAELIF